MSRSHRFVFAALVAAVLSFSAFLPLLQDPDPETENRKISYTLKSGSSVRGVIVESDANRVRLRLSVAGGTSLRWYNIADFDDRSQVRLHREQVAEGDVQAQLRVAELAAEKGLIDMSRIELQRCGHMLDDSERLPDALRTRAFELTIRLLDAFCVRGDVAEARSAVSRLVTRRSDRLSGEEQALLIATVETAAARIAAQKASERRDKEDARTAAEREKRLKVVNSKLERGKAQRRKGLLDSKHYTAASRELRSAAKQFETALKEIESLRKKFAGDAVMLAELDALSAEAVAQWQDSLLSSASLELARGSFNRAMESVNRILADEAANKQALAMRARIEVAQNDWGWGQRF